jgi:hypothetical protein
MPKVTVDHTTSLNTESAFEKIKTFFETDADLKKIDSSIKVEFSKQSGSGKVVGKQFQAEIAIKQANQGSQVTVVVDLPFILTPLKGKVQETIQKKLNKYLA